jgi:hypothetical protein
MYLRLGIPRPHPLRDPRRIRGTVEGGTVSYNMRLPPPLAHLQVVGPETPRLGASWCSR